MAEEQKSLVVDNGSGMVKAGFAGEEHPCSVFPSIIGRPKVKALDGKIETFIGDEAIQKRGICTLSYPIAHGIITSWDDMKDIWNYTFTNELRVTPSEHSVLLTEAPMNPLTNREKMAQIMFEDHDVPALFIQIQAVLSLYAAGRTTGIVVDSGDGVTHTVPIYEGYQIPHAIKKMLLAGRDMTEWMQKILLDSGINLQTTAEREIVKDMKEKKCYVALDYEAEVTKAGNKECDTEYQLPDHTVVTFGIQRFKTPELVFNPKLDGKEMPGVHELTYDSIQACDIDLRKDLFGNIILSGGSTMYEGYGERLQKELKEKVAATMKVKIFASPDRKFMVWKGGATLVSLANFQSMWITKAEYEETGASIVHSRI